MSASRIYSVTITPEALADLERLDTFLRPDNAAAADRMHERLKTGFRNLGENPGLGVSWRMSPPGMDIRELFLRFGRRGYVIRYEVLPDEIAILRLWHFREDRPLERRA